VAFACVFASPAGGGRSGGVVAAATRAAGGMDLPWRRRAVEVRGEGSRGWAVLLPGDAPARRVHATVARLARRGAREVSLSPRFGVPGPGLHLWLAASLQAALGLAGRGGSPARALVVGADTVAGRLALAWLAAKVRFVGVGDAPARSHFREGERLLARLGVAVSWDPVEEPGPAWEGDLVVWACGPRVLGRSVRAPVWLAARWPCGGVCQDAQMGRCCRWAGGEAGTRRPEPCTVVVDALLGGPGLKGIPSWWWKEWGWPEGFLPAGGLEAALGPPARAAGLEPLWRTVRERGWSLAGAVVADGRAAGTGRGGAPGNRGGAWRVVWLTGMGAAHIIGDAQ
jgi:hypothetical protein